MNSATSSLRFTQIWVVVGIGFVLVVAFLSLTPDPLDIGQPTGLKLDHMIAYAWLMFWFGQIYRANGRRILLAIAFCALGVILECCQGMTDYRHFAYGDMLFNAAGVTVGLALSYTPLQYGLRTIEEMSLAKK